MPYIKREDRARAEKYPLTAGELNYAITKLLMWYLDNRKDTLNYNLLQECIGACEAAKLEFYRRVVATYEDAKIEQNGDVY